MSDDEAPPVAAPRIAELVRDLPKWCKAIVYDARRNLIMLRVVVPGLTQRPGYELPIEFVMKPDAARALCDAIGRCVEASTQIVLDVPQP